MWAQSVIPTHKMLIWLFLLPKYILGKQMVNPLLYSCLENAMDRGVWRATVHGVTKESDTTYWLSKYSTKVYSCSSFCWERLFATGSHSLPSHWNLHNTQSASHIPRRTHSGSSRWRLETQRERTNSKASLPAPFLTAFLPFLVSIHNNPTCEIPHKAFPVPLIRIPGWNQLCDACTILQGLHGSLPPRPQTPRERAGPPPPSTVSVTILGTESACSRELLSEGNGILDDSIIPRWSHV